MHVRNCDKDCYIPTKIKDSLFFVGTQLDDSSHPPYIKWSYAVVRNTNRRNVYLFHWPKLWSGEELEDEMIWVS